MQVVAEDLTIERGGRAIVEELSFTVSGGEALVLTGPNGAGKTSLLRTIAGFLRPSRGAIRVDGGDPEKSLGEQAHFIGHANAIKTNLTVRENALFWVSFLQGGGDASNAAARALDAFDVSDLADFPAAYLSAGQKRRLGLSRLAGVRRPLWLLDEPTVSLDAQSSSLLTAAVDAHTAAGGIAIVATHLPLGLQRARALQLGTRQVAA